ncbi:MAG: hypothetical protein ACT4QG_09280 [Sporichthyaceae bacterium]
MSGDGPRSGPQVPPSTARVESSAGAIYIDDEAHRLEGEPPRASGGWRYADYGTARQ